MNTKVFKLIVVLLLIVSIFYTGIVYASKEMGFEGSWFSIDQDGSNQWLWIENYFGVYDVLLFDDGCSACSNSIGERPSCLAVGSAHISNPDTLKIDSGSIYCYWDEGVERLDWFNWETDTYYYPSTDTLEIHSVVWERTKNKAPEKIINPITIPKP